MRDPWSYDLRWEFIKLWECREIGRNDLRRCRRGDITRFRVKWVDVDRKVYMLAIFNDGRVANGKNISAR